MTSQDGIPIAGLPGYVAYEVKSSWLATHKASQGEIPIHDYQALGIPPPRDDLTITYFTRKSPVTLATFMQQQASPLRVLIILARLVQKYASLIENGIAYWARSFDAIDISEDAVYLWQPWNGVSIFGVGSNSHSLRDANEFMGRSIVSLLLHPSLSCCALTEQERRVANYVKKGGVDDIQLLLKNNPVYELLTSTGRIHISLALKGLFDKEHTNKTLSSITYALGATVQFLEYAVFPPDVGLEKAKAYAATPPTKKK